LSVGPRASWVDVAGRRIKLFQMVPNGMQSINVCTSQNKPGKYEQTFYLAKQFRVTPQEIDRYTSLISLVKFLRKRDYSQTRRI